jgi:hypothetical protein
MIVQLQHTGASSNGISEAQNRLSDTYRNPDYYEWIGELVEGIYLSCAPVPIAAIIAAAVKGMSQ